MKTPAPHTPGRKLLGAIAWMLFFGGVFGSLVSFVKITHHVPADQYVNLAIGSGLWLVSSALVVFIRSRL